MQAPIQDLSGAMPEQMEMTMGELAAKIRVRNRNVKVQIARFTFILFVLALWQYADGRWIQNFIISSPIKVAVRLFQEFSSGSEWPDIAITSEELILGYLFGVVLGTGTGLILGSWQGLAAVFEPVITAVNGIPKVALAPLFLLWMGIGIWSKVSIAAMTVYFVMFYNTYLGMKTLPEHLIDVLRLMGAKRSTVIRKVVIPSITPALLAGLKAGVPFAMIGVVVGEFIAADKGVGYQIRYATDMYDSAGMFAGIIILLAMILIGVGLLSLLENRALAWRKK